jgi:hypothetical protein
MGNHKEPSQMKWIENLHIVFWLFKDMSWCLHWKILGMSMILPTLLIGIYIIYRTWDHLADRYHNIAVVLWISANAYWMIAEFYQFDELTMKNGLLYKDLCIIPFSIGIGVLAYYYLIVRKKESLV